MTDVDLAALEKVLRDHSMPGPAISRGPPSPMAARMPVGLHWTELRPFLNLFDDYRIARDQVEVLLDCQRRLAEESDLRVANLEAESQARKREVERLRAFIEAHAFSAGQERCLSCYSWKRNAGTPVAHEPDCELVALLGKVPPTNWPVGSPGQ